MLEQDFVFLILSNAVLVNLRVHHVENSVMEDATTVAGLVHLHPVQEVLIEKIQDQHVHKMP